MSGVIGRWAMSSIVACSLTIGCGRAGVFGGIFDGEPSGKPPDVSDPGDRSVPGTFSLEVVDRAVPAGLRVPLTAIVSDPGATFSWTQVSGPDLLIENESAAVAGVIVPADTADGTLFEFEVRTQSSAGNVLTALLTVTTRLADFERFAPISADDNLGTDEGIAISADAMWVVSMDLNRLSGFAATGALSQSMTLEGRPVGCNFSSATQLVFANSTSERLQAIDLHSGAIRTLAQETDTGAPLGPANYPLPDKDGNIFLSNRTGGQVLRYDVATQETRVFLEGLSNPNALAFGPELDVLYVGTRDAVLRVPINADGSAGAPEPYVRMLLTFSDVDGLAFDEAGNLWIGIPGTQLLLVAPFVPSGPAEVSRAFLGAPSSINKFTSLTFGRGTFGATMLYWTNLNEGTVGRLETGLAGLAAPAAPKLATDAAPSL